MTARPGGAAGAAAVLAFVLLARPVAGGGSVRFSDVTSAAGITFRHVNGTTAARHFIETMGPGVAFLDYNGDGRLDIYFVNGHELGPGVPRKATNALFANRGDGTFADVTEISGAGDRGYGMGITAADYDNDGDEDLYITNYGPNALYRNAGDGTFAEVTQAAGVGDDNWGVGAAFLDYDNDGALDLYVANYVDFSMEHPKKAVAPYLPKGDTKVVEVTAYPHPDTYDGVPDVLYRNTGTGVFDDVTRRAGVYNPGGKGMGVACADYDDDGDTDIYVANDLTPNFLYRNDGDGTFADVGLVSGTAFSEDGKAESSMGVDFGDYNRDGHLDLVVPNFQEEACALYTNRGKGLFWNDSVVSGIALATRPLVGWGVGFVDYDNDGALDLFIAMGHVLDNVELFDSRTTYGQRNLLFHNSGPDDKGRYAFRDVSASAGDGLALAKPSRGAAFGDYDDDGDVDIIVANVNDTPTLLRNDGGNEQHWLRVAVDGTIANRDGIGARVTAVAGDLTQMGEVKSAASLYSQSDLRLSFGLGNKTSVDRVEVRWPGGGADTVRSVAADQTVAIRQGQGLVGRSGP